MRIPTQCEVCSFPQWLPIRNIDQTVQDSFRLLLKFNGETSMNTTRCTDFNMNMPPALGCVFCLNYGVCHVDPFLSLLVYFTYTKRTYF